MALSWAAKRKTWYFLGVFLVILVPLVIFLFVYAYKPPTCFDHQQNGIEEGVDCGGSCALSCAKGIGDLVVKWSQTSPVSSGSYNSIAYIKNKNDQAGIKKITYTFDIYDKDNTLIVARKGSTFVNPGETFAIFEPHIDARYRVPAHTFFSFEMDPKWTRTTKKPPKIDVISRTLTDTGSTPRISATLQNPKLVAVKNVSIVVIVYNTEGNAIASSATYIDNFPRDSKKEITFTWPEPFSEKVSRIEILPRVDLFTIRDL